MPTPTTISADNCPRPRRSECDFLRAPRQNEWRTMSRKASGEQRHRATSATTMPAKWLAHAGRPLVGGLRLGLPRDGSSRGAVEIGGLWAIDPGDVTSDLRNPPTIPCHPEVPPCPTATTIHLPACSPTQEHLDPACEQVARSAKHMTIFKRSSQKTTNIGASARDTRQEQRFKSEQARRSHVYQQCQRQVPDTRILP